MAKPQVRRPVAMLPTACIAGNAAAEHPSMPHELADQPTNVSATSALSADVLARRVDRSGCGDASDALNQFSMVSGFATRGGGGSTRVDGGTLENGGIWRALFWDRGPEHPLYGFRAEPQGDTTLLVMYGIRHVRQQSAVRAVESGKFFCRCRGLAR